MKQSCLTVCMMMQTCINMILLCLHDACAVTSNKKIYFKVENLNSEQLRSFLLNEVTFKSPTTNQLSIDVRYFSWREVANLLGFPSTFEKPPNTTTKQMYRALGNSVSVYIVSLLFSHLLKMT